MSRRTHSAHYFPWTGGVLVLAGIVHIASVLAMHRLAPKDAFARIKAVAGLNQLMLLPRPQPGAEAVPFNDPAVVTGICRYDIRSAPFRLSASVSGDRLLSISFHDRYGRTYYALTDRAAVRGKIEAVIVSAEQKAALEAEDADDGPGPDLRLLTKHNNGFVVIRALAEQPGDYDNAVNRVSQVTCAPEDS